MLRMSFKTPDGEKHVVYVEDEVAAIKQSNHVFKHNPTVNRIDVYDGEPPFAVWGVIER
jgi:hypothetical protein